MGCECQIGWMSQDLQTLSLSSSLLPQAVMAISGRYELRAEVLSGQGRGRLQVHHWQSLNVTVQTFKSTLQS